MGKFAELNQFAIISSHQAATKIYKMRLKLRSVPKRHIPKWVTIKQMEAYVKFAIALVDLDINSIDFADIKKLVAYKNDDNWRFKCIVKSGLFKKDVYDFEWKDTELDDF